MHLMSLLRWIGVAVWDQMIMWRLKGSGYRSNLITDICSFTNYLTSLSHAEDSAVRGGGQGRLAWLFLLWPPCSLGQMGQSQREVSQAHMVVPAMCLVQAPCVPGGWRGGPGALGAGTWGSPTQSLFQKLLARPWHFPGDFPFPRCLNLQDWVANTLLVICLFDLCCFLIHCCYHSQSRYALEVFALLHD